MKIENKKRASIIRLIYLALPIFFIILISISYFLKSFPNYIYLSIIITLFIAAIILLNHLKLFYIIFSNDEGKLILRYLSLGPFGGSRKSLEFPLKDFVNYQISRKTYGYKKEIILYRQTPKGIAKYPPVSISSLNENEIKKIKKILKQLILNNSKKS